MTDAQTILWRLIWNDPLYRLVLLTCAVQIIGLFVLLGVIGLIRMRRRRLNRVEDSVVAAISSSLFEYLAGSIRVDGLIAATRRYDTMQVVICLERYVPSLTGRSADDLSVFFGRSGLLSIGERMSKSIFWWGRLEGARILSAGGGRVAAPTLLRMLQDRNPTVRLAAARGLGRTQDPSYIEPLLRMLGRGGLARAQVAEVLVQLGTESRQHLRELVMQLPPDPRTSMLRATTIEVLALVGDAGATPFIQYALASGDSDVRVSAFRAATIVRAPLTRDEVRGGLRDPNWPVRAQAVRLIGRIQMAALARDAAALLDDKSWWVRLYAARALYELGPPGIALLESIGETHQDPYARGMAKRVLTEDPSYSAFVALRDRRTSTHPVAASAHWTAVHAAAEGPPSTRATAAPTDAGGET